MINREKANEWIERMMDGEDIPPDVERYIENSPECQEYKNTLESVVFALDSLSIPEPPADLADIVMGYIEARDDAESQPVKPRQSIWVDVWNTCWDCIPDIGMPVILRREGVPAFVTVCIVLFGVFISPQVEAGKDIKDFKIVEQVSTCADWMVEESDRIYEYVDNKASGLINRVTTAFQLKDGAAEEVSDSPTNNGINGGASSYSNDAKIEQEDLESVN
jgi:hypothetical protein